MSEDVILKISPTGKLKLAFIWTALSSISYLCMINEYSVNNNSMNNLPFDCAASSGCHCRIFHLTILSCCPTFWSLSLVHHPV